ncbi:MAG: hypothetical protein ACUVRX_11245 [Actinomycetota bacterium]
MKKQYEEKVKIRPYNMPQGSVTRGGASSRATIPLKGIPEDAIRKAFEDMLERTYGNWLDEPIPNLGGKTPGRPRRRHRGAN